MPIDLFHEETVGALRRGRFLLNVAWLACLGLGPYLVFECGKYRGRVEAYKEEHSRELYYINQEARADV
jgi:hypothetical protein